MTLGELIAYGLALYFVWWFVSSRELTGQQKTGIFALISLISIAFCAGGKK